MQYYIYLNGQQQGPFEENELPLRGVTPETSVWCQSMTDWMPASQVPALSYIFTRNDIPRIPPKKDVDFVDAFKVCFSKFFEIKGRARRSEFWFFYLWMVLISMVTCGMSNIVFFIPLITVGVRRLHDTGRSGWWIAARYLIYIIMLFTLFCGFIEATVYYHRTTPNGVIDWIIDGDCGIALLLEWIVNAIYSIMLLIFFCQDSQMNANKYGPSPKY